MLRIYIQLQEKCKLYKQFYLALDESKDVCDTAQLLIFVQGVESVLVEGLAAIQSLKGTTGKHKND